MKLNVPLASDAMFEPALPAIVTSADHTQALLGFFAQPTNTLGRDFVARVDCVSR